MSEAKPKWVYPNGDKATKRCPNDNRITRSHLLSAVGNDDRQSVRTNLKGRA